MLHNVARGLELTSVVAFFKMSFLMTLFDLKCWQVARQIAFLKRHLPWTEAMCCSQINFWKIVTKSWSYALDYYYYDHDDDFECIFNEPFSWTLFQIQTPLCWFWEPNTPLASSLIQFSHCATFFVGYKLKDQTVSVINSWFDN